MKIKTWDLSGMGGGYENACQQMLWDAVRFLFKNKTSDIMLKQSPQVYGLMFVEGKDGKAFEEAMMENVKDCTGAMHQCVSNHAFYIGKNGYDKWYSELKEGRRDEQSFEFEYQHEIDLS